MASGAEAAAKEAVDVSTSMVEEEERSRGFVREKRPPVKPSTGQADIYVTRNSSFIAQLQKCRRLLAKGLPEIYVHAIGPAMPRAINLALTLAEESCGTLALNTSTSTVRVVDDLMPDDEEDMPRSEVRMKSAVNIRVHLVDAEGYERLQKSAGEADKTGADCAEEDTPESSTSAGKSKKKKRNRSSAGGGRSRAESAGKGGGKSPSDMKHAEAVAAECREAMEQVAQGASQSSGPIRRSRRKT